MREYAAELAAQCSPRALRITKRQIYTNQFVDLEASIAEADREQVACFSTADFREGLASFLEKRKPEWRGL